MEIISQPLPGLLLFKPTVFQDARGHFFESYRQDALQKMGITEMFVQDNQSLSGKGIIRGLHFQKPPHAQDKLVRVIKGKVLDAVVDIRSDSPTFGKGFSVELSEDNFLMMFIPKGFAHGFETLAPDTIFTYKCSDYYYPETEGSIHFNSPEFQFPWQTQNPILSDKDKNSPYFADFVSPF